MVSRQENWFTNYSKHWPRLQSLSISPGSPSLLLAALITALCSKKKSKKEKITIQPCHPVSQIVQAPPGAQSDPGEPGQLKPKVIFLPGFPKCQIVILKVQPQESLPFVLEHPIKSQALTCHRPSEHQGTIYTLGDRGTGALLCLVLKVCG